MQTNDHYQREITGYTDVLETVKTLEKVAASKLHSLRDTIVALRDYQKVVGEILARLHQFESPTEDHFRPTGTSRLLVLFVLHGKLTGGMWSTVLDFYRQHNDSDSHTILVGADGAGQILPPVAPEEHFTYQQEVPTVADIRIVADHINTVFESGAYSGVDILYAQPLSIAEQHPVKKQLLPLAHEKVTTTASQGPIGWPLFLASGQTLSKALRQKVLEQSLLQAALETHYSELAARTITMEHATQKTKDVITELKHGSARAKRHTATEHQLSQFVNQTTI